MSNGEDSEHSEDRETQKCLGPPALPPRPCRLEVIPPLPVRCSPTGSSFRERVEDMGDCDTPKQTYRTKSFSRREKTSSLNNEELKLDCLEIARASSQNNYLFGEPDVGGQLRLRENDHIDISMLRRPYKSEEPTRRNLGVHAMAAVAENTANWRAEHGVHTSINKTITVCRTPGDLRVPVATKRQTPWRSPSVLATPRNVSQPSSFSARRQTSQQDERCSHCGAPPPESRVPPSCSRAIECVTCLFCLKSLLYHTSTDEGGGEEDLCSCAPSRHRCLRWSCLSLATLCCPVLLCYWPLRWSAESCAECTRPACRCKEKRRKSDDLFPNLTAGATTVVTRR